MTKTRSSSYAHSILALAAATANNATTVAADERRARQPVRPQKPDKTKAKQEERMRKQIGKKLTTGKVKRMIRAECKRHAKDGNVIAEKPRIRATARLSIGGKHWEVSEVSVA